MRKIRLIITTLTILGLSFVPVFAVSTAFAIDQGSKDAACDGLTGVGQGCDTAGANTSVTGLIATAINILSWIVGVAAVIMLLVGGFRYVTSGGDANSISAAKNTILYAIIGLVVAALAQALVRFVLRRIST